MEIATSKLKKNVRTSKVVANGEASTPSLSQATLFSMLEDAPINVMLADLDGTIIYLNQKSIDTLTTIESELPVGVNEIVGGSYDVFHKNPAHQRKLLGNERNLPHRAIISVGHEKLDLLVTAVKDENGRYIGPMVTWDVVTEKLKLEDDVARIRSMMENAPINIMSAGLDGKLNYINPKSRETLKTLEKYLPVKVDELLGQSYDIFHKNPSHQRNLLSNERNLPHQAVISVGPEKLDLLVSAMRDRDGKYIGPMVTWSVVTEKLRTEQEMSRVQSMMENAPVNVMMANLDFQVMYINPKSRETLKTLEKHLPVPVDKIIGSSIDVFHKNPDKQRRMLGDPRNLPHRAKIKVGPETLDLLVSPIFDKDKKYLGPMVTWEVISGKLQLIDSLEQTSNQLSAAAEELSAVATHMSSNAGQTSEKSNLAAANAEEVSKGVQTVATNTEEMAASIKEISKSSSEAADISKDAMQKANDTNVTINHLGEASQEIGNVIKVISSIAQQTNLLALNATIEAARAGDAGKGFAVVANEVKELAKQTAKATEEITNKIAAIQDTSKGAIDAIGGIAKVIEQINGISMTIAAAVEEQTATTNEVSRVVQESNQAVDGIAQTVKTVAAAAQESSTGAAQTLEAAKSLSDLATRLKDLVKKVEV